MEGKQIRNLLQKHRVNLTWLSEQLGISNQALNSRLNAREFKLSYMHEITTALGYDIFGLPVTDGGTNAGIPVYDTRICAGNGIDISDDQESIIEYVNIPSFGNCVGVLVYGDSMYPLYHSSDIVFVRRIESRNDIDYGNTYVIITRSERFLKMLYPSTRGDDFIRMCSYNAALKPDGERLYPDNDMPFDNIIYIYKVIGHLRRNQI